MKIFLPSILLLFSLSSQAQHGEKEAVMKVVTQVFEAMRTNDSTLLKSCFVDDPNTFTVYTKEGQTQLSIGDFARFVHAVGQPKDQVWNEPVWNEKVEIDGALASVWVDYAFYLDDKLLHCGVDAFHLIKEDGHWKIFHLVDTRRKTGCIIPEEAKP